jgi:orotate phosphoribosyltransferase
VERIELASRIRDVSYLTGRFTLRSGKRSTFYWDKYRFESDPELMDAIAGEMVKLLPESFDRLAGLALGGVPLVAVISLKTGKPCLYVRKVAKEYGTCNLVEGGFSRGETAVVIEDVVTVGGQVCASVEQMRELGLVVSDVLCVIDRQQGAGENLRMLGCSLRSLFTLAELVDLTEPLAGGAGT